MQSKSVLLIEDDGLIRETLQIALEMEGYLVVTARNGQEGLSTLLKMTNPSLILLDLMMPVMNGWEFIETISKDVRLVRIPVVVVTAFNVMEKSVKANDFLKKPVNFDVLIKTVKRYCG